MLVAVRERDAQAVVRFLRRRVHSLTQEALARMCGVAQSTITRAEAGRGLTDRRKAIEALQGLGAPLGNVEKMRPPTPSGTVHGGQLGMASAKLKDVERRRFLRTAGTSVAISPLLGVTGDVQTAPSAVNSADLDQIHQAATVFASWDHGYGGAGVRAAVTAHLRWAVDLLDRSIPTELRAPTFSAVARLSMVSGFMAFDAYAHSDARRMFSFAAQAAEEADDWRLRAKIFSNRARQEIWCQRPDKGLTFAELGLVRADRLSAPEQAMLHTARARAYAKLQDTQACLAAIGAADEAFSRTTGVTPPPWMAYYDEAQHHGDTGHALWDLAVVGGAPAADAERRLAIAVNGHTDAYRRSRAISGIKLASLQMRFTDPDQAQVTALAALEDMGQVESKRAQDDLRELSTTASRHQAHELSEYTASMAQGQV